MFSLFEIETVLQEEVLVSIENPLQEVIIRVKESSGKFPFSVSIENVSKGFTHGKQTHSFPQKEQAEDKYGLMVEQYQQNGYSLTIAS